MSSPRWAVAGQCTHLRLSPGRYGRTPRGSPMSLGARWMLSPERSSSRRGRSTAGPSFGPTSSSAGSGSRMRLVHHSSPNGAALATSTVTARSTARRRGRRATGSPAPWPGTPAGPTKQSGPADRRARADVRGAHHPELGGEAGRGVGGRRRDPEPGPGQDDAGSQEAEQERSGHHVAQGLDPAGAAVVGHDAPAENHQGGAGDGDERPDGSDEARDRVGLGRCRPRRTGPVTDEGRVSIRGARARRPRRVRRLRRS